LNFEEKELFRLERPKVWIQTTQQTYHLHLIFMEELLIFIVFEVVAWLIHHQNLHPSFQTENFHRIVVELLIVEHKPFTFLVLLEPLIRALPFL